MKGSNRRRAWAASILVLWAVVVAVHVRREYFAPEIELLTRGARALAPVGFFYAVRMNGRPIGMAGSQLDSAVVGETGYIFEDWMILDVPALDTIHRATTRTTIEMDLALELKNFNFRLNSEIGRFNVRGVMRGDSALELEVGGAARSRAPTTLPVDGGAMLAAMLPLRLAASGRLRVGESFRTEVFDPSMMAQRAVTIDVVERDTIIVADSAFEDTVAGVWRRARYDTLLVWRTEQSFGGVDVVSWLDEDGRVVRAISPMGLYIERTAYEIARQVWQRASKRTLARGYGPIINTTAIASNVDLDARGPLDRLRVRLGGVALDGFDLDGARQTLSGDTLTITREVLGGSAVASESRPASADDPVPGTDRESPGPAYELPYEGDGAPAEALSATPLIQTDDPAILEIAGRIAGGETDPTAVARRLNAWVYDALDKDITLSVPSAVQVLEARQGDCNEHTVLYVALARALGLPARTAVGLVHLRGHFYYHAWPEVWLDGRWVAVDPTLGQFPADAGHLRFINGGLARQIELIRLIGRLEIEVLPTDTDLKAAP